jgi:cell division protein FtsL
MKLVKILTIIIIALVIGSVTLTNRNVDESVEVANLTKQITVIQNQNTVLTAEVAELGSLTHVSSEISALGFTDTPKIASIPTPPAVALR